MYQNNDTNISMFLYCAKKYIISFLDKYCFVDIVNMIEVNCHRLNSLLNDRGVTGIWLAKKLNVRPNTVSNYRNYITPLPLERAYEICTLLNVDLFELIITLDEYQKQVQQH